MKANSGLKKNRTKPTDNTTHICTHFIFSSFTPLVPRQDKARNTTQKSFV